MTTAKTTSDALCRAILASPLARAMDVIGTQSLPAYAAFVAAVFTAAAMRLY